MKNKTAGRVRFIVAGVASFVCSISALSVEITTADPIFSESDSGYTLTVPAGTTNYYSGVINVSKWLDVQGDGMLVLQNPENKIGSVDVSANASVRIDAQGAQGSDRGTFILRGSRARILFNCEGLRFKNSINPKAKADYTKVCTVAAMKSVVCDSRIYGTSFSVGTEKGYEANAVWNGEIEFQSSEGRASCILPFGTNTFNGTIKSTDAIPACLKTDVSASSYGPIFLNASNDLAGIEFIYAGVECGAEESLGGGYISHTRGHGDREGVFRLNGFNQHLTYISNACVTAGRIPGPNNIGSRFESFPPAALTLKGGAANARSTSIFMFGTNVSLVCDFAEPSFLQIISNRTHTTQRSVEVRRGLVRFDGENTWKSLAELKIGAEGVLTNASVSASSLAALTNICVSGRFVQTNAGPSPFGDSVKSVSIDGSNASVELPSDCVLRTEHLFVNGKDMPRGRYSASSLALPQLKTGAIHVTVGCKIGMIVIAR